MDWLLDDRWFLPPRPIDGVAYEGNRSRCRNWRDKAIDGNDKADGNVYLKATVVETVTSVYLSSTKRSSDFFAGAFASFCSIHPTRTSP